MPTPVTTSLIDPNDQPHQPDPRTGIEKPIKSIEHQFTQQTLWIVGFGITMTAIIIAVLR